MLVIRRMITRRQTYSVIMLPPDVHKVIPTTEQEHQRLLEIYKQDRPYPDIINDFYDGRVRCSSKGSFGKEQGTSSSSQNRV